MQTYLSSLLFSHSSLPLSAKAPMPVPIFVQGKKRTNTEKFSLKEAPCYPAGIHSKAIFAIFLRFLFDLKRIRF